MDTWQTDSGILSMTRLSAVQPQLAFINQSIKSNLYIAIPVLSVSFVVFTSFYSFFVFVGLFVFVFCLSGE